ARGSRRGSARDCGGKWRALSARFARRKSSSRTRRTCARGDSTSGSGILPGWGTMRRGELWALTTPALPTKESGCGYWPTLVKGDGGKTESIAQLTRRKAKNMAKGNKTLPQIQVTHMIQWEDAPFGTGEAHRR